MYLLKFFTKDKKTWVRRQSSDKYYKNIGEAETHMIHLIRASLLDQFPNSRVFALIEQRSEISEENN